jgi:hypothetical protein
VTPRDPRFGEIGRAIASGRGDVRPRIKRRIRHPEAPDLGIVRDWRARRRNYLILTGRYELLATEESLLNPPGGGA